ncbi:MAG: hypothetical protein EXQ49_11075 [Acidobacteria bacterium]|nr:hypothetical protein [Acidobacteriota bacterium]
MRQRVSSHRLPFTVLAVACLAAVLSAQVGQPPARVAVTVTPDRADWTYELGAPVRFRNGRLLLPVATADS